MICPHCNSTMDRDDEAYGQWHCFECGYDALCRRCLGNPVHPHRKWQICLDCICDLLEENGTVSFNLLWKEKINDPCSSKRKRLHDEKHSGKKQSELLIKPEEMILVDTNKIPKVKST